MKEFLEKLDEAKVKLGIRIAAVVAMACFFFPFFTVSCNMASVDITGADIARGFEEYDIAPKPVVSVVLLLAGVVLAATFVAKAKPWLARIGLIGSAAGLVSMFLIWNGFVNVLEDMGASSKEVAAYTDIEFGFWGCILGYFGIGLFSWLYRRYTAQEPMLAENISESAPPVPPVRSAPPPVAPIAPPTAENGGVPQKRRMKTCPCCRHTQDASKPECEGCGYRFIIV